MGTAAFGAQVWFDNESGTLTRLGEALSVKPPFYAAAAIDTTHHGSTGGLQTQIPSGVKSVTPGSVTLQIDPGSAEDVMLAAASATARVGTYKIVMPGTTPQAYGGEGFIAYEPGAATPDGKMEATLTITPTGAMTQSADS